MEWTDFMNKFFKIVRFKSNKLLGVGRGIRNNRHYSLKIDAIVTVI